MRLLQFPFGVVEFDAEIEEEGAPDELARSIFYFFKYLEREAA